ncbi:ISNCY family transposase [Inquilinus limosus]|uniref:ISNCY family transposase n=1 Tax=Inquilinus limosus TaxID=171674 RepID=UPI003F1778B0
MRRTEQLQGLRMLKLRDVLSRWDKAELSQLEAAELLGVSERTFRRWSRRLEEEGEAGLVDRRLGRRSGRAASDEAREWVARLYRERYAGWTVKHFHERLVSDHGFTWGYTWTKTLLQGRGLVAPAPRRGAHRRKRPRRPLVGMMLHQDASQHVWLSGLGPLDLVVTLDDATSAIYSAVLVEEEGTQSSFRGLAETIAGHGLFCSLYTDRGSHYFHTPAAGGKVAKETPTQVGRALAQLGIEHIPAYSPEARGRSERAFRTLQDRLPKELRLAGIVDDVAVANRYLREVYIPAHNARFATTPAEAGSAFVPVEEHQWRDILCVQVEWTVAPDNTVAYDGRRLQIPPHPARAHFVRAKVRVHDYPDGTMAIFHGPRCLVRWRPGEIAPPDDQLRVPSAAFGADDAAAVPATPSGLAFTAAAPHNKAVTSCAT